MKKRLPLAHGSALALGVRSALPLAFRSALALGVASTLALVLVALRLLPHDPLRDQASSSQAFHSADGQLLRITLAKDEQYRVWTPLDRIDPKLVEAVQLYEDRWFFLHPGVNPAALMRAAWSTASGERRRGGSTLTMQLARRLHRMDTRSVGGKLQQMAVALWLEARHGKREILEAYLNLAPYGGNVEGVEAASLIVFGKPAAVLSLPEALSLAVIPQHPNRRGAAARDAASTRKGDAALHAARSRLAAAWFERRPEDASPAALAAMALPLRLRSPSELPFLAPHAVQAMVAGAGIAGGGGEVPVAGAGGSNTLSLHLPTQVAVERAIAQFVETRRALGVRNAAALLVDTRTMHVRAWVGSADWRDPDIEGQVNATTAKRSPGSTLKPFIYALGLDQGVLHPRTVLRDAPTAFGTYSPENFDGRFEGPITAQEALIRSRNIPAVQVASRLTRPGLHSFLQAAGVTRMASEQHYGLALSLGGGEVTMEEVAVMYAMLANGGRLRPLVKRLPAPSGSRTQADGAPAMHGANDAAPPLSPEAAFITLEMLQSNPRPDTGQRAFPAVAWKTGTSWGFRDAWTAGVFGRHVLVVWAGNFDGSANPAFVGVQTAAPLFFHIVDSLRAQGLDPGDEARSVPPGVKQVDVCAASGDLPNSACPRLASTWFIPGVSPIKLSTLHREVWVDSAGRATCEGAAGARREVHEYWSSDMMQVFAQSGMPRRTPPRSVRCGGAPGHAGARNLAGQDGPTPGDDGPRITSPLRGGSYLMRLKEPTPIALRADTAGTVYWFADAAYVGSAGRGEALNWLPDRAGRTMLSAVDASGASDSRELVVEIVP